MYQSTLWWAGHDCISSPESHLSVSVRAEPGSTCLSVAGQAHLSHTPTRPKRAQLYGKTSQVTEIAFDRIIFVFSLISPFFFPYQNLCPSLHLSSGGSLSTSALIVTSHSCDFSYNQRCMVMLSGLEDRRAIQSLAHTHTHRKGQLSSGSAKQRWQPALAYSQPFTINTVKRRADSHGAPARWGVLG